MGTQGLVTVMRGGRVAAKLTAGCNGYNARDLATEVVRRLRAADPHLLEFLMEHTQFGCEACRVVTYRDSLGVICVHMARDTASHIIEGGSDGRSLWVSKFDDVSFNPRWTRGTADHCFVVDLDRGKIRRARYSGGKIKWLGEAETVL